MFSLELTAVCFDVLELNDS